MEKPIEEEYIEEDRVVFYAKTEKTIYKTGERLQTWAKYDWLENGWFPWDYYYFRMPVGIDLIHLDITIVSTHFVCGVIAIFSCIVDLPIIVIENENKKEFYSNPNYPVPPVQQIK